MEDEAKLIRRLVTKGLTDDHMRSLHHLKDNIRGFLRWVEKANSLRGNNLLVIARLRRVEELLAQGLSIDRAVMRARSLRDVETTPVVPEEARSAPMPVEESIDLSQREDEPPVAARPAREQGDAASFSILDLAKQARDLLGPEFCARGGRVLYSEPVSLVDPSGIYFLGINPKKRGDVYAPDLDHHSVRTIGRDLELLAAGRVGNAYLDESDWSASGPLQERVVGVLAASGVTGEDAIRRTLASNVVFERTVSEPSGAALRALADRCWPVHRRLLEIVQPWRIIVAGTSAGKELVRCLGGTTESAVHVRRLRTANYSIRVFALNGREVVVLPSLSRWAGTTGDADAATAIEVLGKRWI